MRPPRTRSAHSGDAHTAFQVFGEGDIRFEDRGAQDLKGVPGEWRLFAVER